MPVQTLSLAVLQAFARLNARLTLTGRDRGDVPGWVLVTLMTAGLVTALWVVAKDQLVSLLNTALTNVIG